ncbi:MAG: AraC family transcriptional regulator [Niameybacter sp.]
MAAQVMFSIVTKDMEKLPFYITGIGMDYEENGVTRDEGYEDYQWSYCLEGEGIFTVEGQSYTISKGMAFFFKKNVPHTYESLTQRWKTTWITFNGDQVESLMNYLEVGSSLILNLEREGEVKQRYKELFYTLNTASYRRESMLKASLQLYELIVYMQQHRLQYQNEGKSKTYDRLSPVIDYMEQHYRDDITLEQLAEQIGVTKYYLCRLFKDIYGSKPFDYLNQMRIQKAKEYLVTREQMKVKEIGELVGYHDTSYFCLKFKTYEGCSPVEFRRKYNFND